MSTIRKKIVEGCYYATCCDCTAAVIATGTDNKELRSKLYFLNKNARGPYSAQGYRVESFCEGSYTFCLSMIKWYNFDFNKLSSNDLS